MRISLIALLLLLPAAPLMACEGFEHDMGALEHQVKAPGLKPETASFARAFSSVDELQKWTETSTLGGGRTETVEFEGRKFIFAFRSYTSGVKSSDAAVYMQDGEDWKLVKAYPVLMNDWIVADQQDDGSILFHPESESRSLMVLSRADVQSF